MKLYLFWSNERENDWMMKEAFKESIGALASRAVPLSYCACELFINFRQKPASPLASLWQCWAARTLRVSPRNLWRYPLSGKASVTETRQGLPRILWGESASPFAAMSSAWAREAGAIPLDAIGKRLSRRKGNILGKDMFYTEWMNFKLIISSKAERRISGGGMSNDWFRLFYWRV